MAAATREDVLSGMDHQTRLISIALAASLVCHLIFFSILIYMQTHDFKRGPAQAVIRVSLVSLPKQAAPTQPARSAETAPAKAEPERPPEANKVSTEANQRPADVSLAPRKKTSLKKKTFRTEKVKKRAFKELEKEIETTSSERIAEAIDRIKSKVENEDAKSPSKTDAGLEKQSGSVLGDEKDSGGKRAGLIDIYRVEIAFQIQKNWAFPDQLAEGRTDLQAWLVFNVMPNGEIRDLFFTDRSGNKRFDESAYRAVMKSNPVAPHPRGVSEPFIEMGLHFTPKGIK